MYAHCCWGVLLIRPEMDDTNTIRLSFFTPASVPAGNHELYAARERK